MFDAPHSLSQLIEHGQAAFEQGVAVNSGLDALWATIEQPHADRSFQIADRLRDRRLSNPQARSGLGHAAAFRDREKNMKIAQPDAPADTAFPVDGFGHKRSVIRSKAKRLFHLYHGRVRFQSFALEGTVRGDRAGWTRQHAWELG